MSKDKVGVTVPCLADGDKINVGGNVAMRFSNADDAANIRNIQSSKRRLSITKILSRKRSVRRQVLNQ